MADCIRFDLRVPRCLRRIERQPAPRVLRQQPERRRAVAEAAPPGEAPRAVPVAPGGDAAGDAHTRQVLRDAVQRDGVSGLLPRQGGHVLLLPGVRPDAEDAAGRQGRDTRRQPLPERRHGVAEGRRDGRTQPRRAGDARLDARTRPLRQADRPVPGGVALRRDVRPRPRLQLERQAAVAAHVGGGGQPRRHAIPRDGHVAQVGG